MVNYLVKKICDALVRWCEKTGRIYYITGGENREAPTVYLVRYLVFKSKLFSFYIHRFMRSDSDVPHDHPWNFFTYVISGGYKEVFYDRKAYQTNENQTEFTSLWTRKLNTRLPGSLAYRRATDIHQVVVDREYEMSEIQEAPYTICLIGPRFRQWGFWKDSATFTDWRQYLKISPTDPAFKGSE